MGASRYGAIMIDVSAVAAVPRTHAKPELILHDRPTERHARLIAETAIVGGCNAGAGVPAEFRQTGLRLDETDDAALGARPEQRSLRSSQNLHAVEVEYLGRRIGPRDDAAVQADLHRHIVDVDARGGVADGA